MPVQPLDRTCCQSVATCLAYPRDQRLILAGDHATFGGGHVFVTEKTKGREIAEDRGSLGADSVGRILDENKIMIARERTPDVRIGRIPRVMHDNHGFRVWR